MKLVYHQLESRVRLQSEELEGTRRRLRYTTPTTTITTIEGWVTRCNLAPNRFIVPCRVIAISHAPFAHRHFATRSEHFEKGSDQPISLCSVAISTYCCVKRLHGNGRLLKKNSLLLVAALPAILRRTQDAIDVLYALLCAVLHRVSSLHKLTFCVTAAEFILAHFGEYCARRVTFGNCGNS